MTIYDPICFNCHYVFTGRRLRQETSLPSLSLYIDSILLSDNADDKDLSSWR